MRVVNKTRNKVLSEDAGVRESFLGRLTGLMMQDRKDIVIKVPWEGILEASIHMMFMRYGISVIWADSDMKVVDVEKNARPFNPFKPRTWRTYKPCGPAKYVVELGKGRLGGTRRGDVIEFTH
ncbi:MAG: DUF192 domain-containing protein [Candidatus Altiarchaeota archaeon]